jgi:hypothetical protein
MRRIFLLLTVLCNSAFVFSQNNIDVLHYKFNIGLNDVNDTIYGVAEIKIKFLQPASEVSFDLTKTKDNGKGMKVGKLQGNNIRGSIYKEESLRILLSQNMNAGDTATFIIPYSGIPADGLIISKTKYGHRSFFCR